jgi:transcriptional regulator with PAS, ATPase and Fis domain
MGAVTESLFESELFGHVKGAFTDAHETRQGKFEIADRGTLFLDEIGNISLHLQSKLLTVIESRQIIKVGSNNPVKIDIRLICATNRNIENLVRDGLFREDLLYRINTIHIELPPLRDRGDDIIILAEFFLKKYGSRYNKPGLKLNRHAYDRLMNYRWPGNVRELQHTIEKAVILSDSVTIKSEDLSLRDISVADDPASITKIDEMEMILIRRALEMTDGNYTAAAEQLGITRQTLYNKLKNRQHD